MAACLNEIEESVFGIQPDILTFAKGVTSGYQPLGGLVRRCSRGQTFLQRRLILAATRRSSPTGC